jgi:hypothetical protein
MMKLALAIFAAVLAVSAATIDGDWNAQSPAFTLSLKTKDGQVSGIVTVAGKKKPRVQNVQNARLDGNTLTFTTVQTGKKGTAAFSWQVTVDGDQMTGTRTREGAKRSVPFKAKRSA